MICPGSAHVDNKDTESSEAAAEGNRAHAESASLLIPKGEWFIPENLKYEIRPYLEYIFSLEGNIYVETEVTLSSVSDEIYGTADCIVEDTWEGMIHVIDLKYGIHNLVEAPNNPQLATYGLAALDRFGSNYDEIWLTIVQPRMSHKDGVVRTWKTTPTELRKTWLPKIKKAYNTAITKPKFYREGNHCMWCSGAWECTKATNTVVNTERSQRKEAPVSSDSKKLAKILNQEQMVLQYFNTAKQMAFKKLVKGEAVPGFKLVKSFARNRKWKDENKLVVMFDLSAVEDAFNSKLKSPAQMEKSKILSDEQIAAHVHHPYQGLKMVPEDDKRTAYQSAAAVFAESPVKQLGD
jgi:hypothetical protein